MARGERSGGEALIECSYIAAAGKSIRDRDGEFPPTVGVTPDGNRSSHGDDNGNKKSLATCIRPRRDGGILNMLRPRLNILIVALAALLAGCSHDATSITGHGIVLTAAQADLLATRVGQVVASAPELSWLADSINVVLSGGDEATSVSIQTTLASAPFYAVGLERRFVPKSANAFSTLTFIAFDNPDNPTDFVFVNAYAPSTNSTPPDAVSGNFSLLGSQQLSGYVFHISGTQITTWQSSGAGSASLSSSGASGTCAQFQTTGVTCDKASLLASFTIDAGPDVTGAPRTATMAATSVTAVRLTFSQ